MNILEQIQIRRMEVVGIKGNSNCVYLGKDAYKQLISEAKPKQCYSLKKQCPRFQNIEFSFCNTCCRMTNYKNNIETVFGLEIIRVKGKRYKDYISVGIKE